MEKDPEHGATKVGVVTRYDLWDLVEPEDPSAAFPAGCSYHCSASDGSNNIFVHAGCPETGRLSDLWAFSLDSRAWAELPAAPLPACGGASIAFFDCKLYCMNGFNGTTEQGGSLDVYDCDACPCSVLTLVAVKAKGWGYLVTMFGERDPSSLGHAGAGKMLADVWAFDVQELKWAKIEPVGDAPPPRGWFDADMVREDGGKHAIIVHGGLAEDNSRLGDVWKLQIS
ncbi:kelch repeat protein [Phialemonium atrogriseum]|uniref:Kelch repeat protein n=1 Tax=Phialemonium atrogriseum TaxID=1093897 RepID=A0AAJ0FMA1_9PEZI|nr:kelch repeat protein [Phialemonium atrogriseum]KAK1768118.1 kelch repeat protein [Phialemonium atrogriseum]